MANTKLQIVKTYVDLLPNEEMIWIGKPYFGENLTIKYFFIFCINLFYIVYVIYLIFWRNLLIFDFHNINIYSRQLFALSFFAIAVYSVVKSIGSLFNQSSMTYGFSNLRVFWARKDFKVIVNDLPFSKIAKISLVGTDQNDKLFSIYFSPTETLSFEGYNYEDDDSRPFPTFEKVLNGDVVYMQLMKFWEVYKIG